MRSQTAYRVTVVYKAYVPPAAYDAEDADDDVDQPRKLYPVRVGFVDESVTFVPSLCDVALGAPLPLFAL
jgi:hypothetical protein